MKRRRYGEEREERSRKRYGDGDFEEDERRRASKRKRRMHGDIPMDAWVEILSRLPARCVWKLRSVCKGWKSIIESPSFAHLQLRQFKPKEEDHKIFMYWRPPVGWVYNETRFYSIDKYGEADRVAHDKFFAHLSHTKTSSINGLICYYASDFNIRVRNLVTREKITLPKPSFLSSPRFEHAHLLLDLGIGFDSTTNTYKVLASSILNPPQVEIFTLGDRTTNPKAWTWRNLQLPSSPHIKSYCEGGFFANGCAFWLTSTQKSDGHLRIPLVSFILLEQQKYQDRLMLGTLVTFDFAQEKFEDFPFPPDIEINSTTSHWLNQVGGHPSLIQAKEKTTMVKMWTLVPDSSGTQVWVPHNNILLPPFQESLREPALLPIPNGVMMFKKAYTIKHMVNLERYTCFYDEQGQVVESIRVHGIPTNFSPLQPHTESLVSLRSILAANL